MNRSILIVICDFLLVSLLAFSTVDINKVADQGTAPQLRLVIATNQVESGKDLAAVMRGALEEERKNRDLLMGELNRSRQTAGEREKEAVNFRQQLQTREAEAQRLQQQQTALQQQQATLQQQYAAAQTNIQSLSQQLQSTSAEALISKEKLAAMEAELRKQAEQAAALKGQLSQLATSNQVALNEKERLAGQLQVAEVEKRHAVEQVARMQDEVKVEREEKAKLAEGVKQLANKSGQLEQEIRENRPLAPNTIFNDFVSNRVEARFTAHRSGLIGSSKRKEAQTILVTDGTNTFALCHVEDTPLTLWNPGTDWDQLTGTLTHNAAQTPVRSLSFDLEDPRVVLLAISPAEAKQLGSKIYRISATPFKFQDAVLIGAGAGESYYGECKFEIDTSTPQYVKLDRSFVRGLFGKFNPSRGDMVFSKTGEFLGIMANSTYCLMVRSFDVAATLQFGPDGVKQRTGDILSVLYARVVDMPQKLQ